MQIELIETFLDLCETRSFNRTAERLGVTQSTVSGRVRTLERLIERRLFSRSRSGTALTTEGLMFEPHARSLRIGWVDALQAARHAGSSALTLRIGIQHDLAGSHISEWVDAFLTAFPQTSIYVEADYSAQMCADLATGMLDIAMMFTPKPQPDLHFVSVGEIGYRMVSTDARRLSEVRAETYILANISSAFSRTHAQLHPGLSTAQVSSGQNATVAGLLSVLGGSAYVLEETAIALESAGLAHRVLDGPLIDQSVYAAVHVRNRHRKMHRRLMRLLQSDPVSYGRAKPASSA